MTTIPNPQAETEAPAPSPTERRARISALQSELELLDNVRDRVRNALREVHELREFTDVNPVRFRRANAVAAAAADTFTEVSSALTTEMRKLDQELTDLCRDDLDDRITIKEMVARGDALGVVQVMLGEPVSSSMSDRLAEMTRDAAVKAGKWARLDAFGDIVAAEPSEVAR